MVRGVSGLPHRVDCVRPSLPFSVVAIQGEDMSDHVVPHFHNDAGVSVIEIGSQEFMCVGANPPFDHPHVFLDLGNDNEKKTTKAEFLKALADSFAFCDGAYAALTDANSHDFVRLGQGEIARAAALANNLAHNNEMYGTASVYMRAKGLVPPSTERQMQGRGGRGNPGRQ